MRNVSIKVVEKIKTHILSSINSFENRAGSEKCGTDGEATDDNKIRRRKYPICMPGK
jgi:hypothetical protein